MYYSHDKLEIRRNLNLIKNAFPRLFPNLRKPQPLEVRLKRPDDEVLKSCYMALSRTLEKRHPESFRTLSEKKFYEMLSESTKRKILRSVWIGSHCIDIFIPNVRSNRLQNHFSGLAVEIDGKCHEREDKMKRDQFKGIQLATIKIGLTHIENSSFFETSVKTFINEFNSMPDLDSRERKRLWLKIYLFTLAHKLSNRDFFQIFGLKQDQIRELP